MMASTLSWKSIDSCTMPRRLRDAPGDGGRRRGGERPGGGPAAGGGEAEVAEEGARGGLCPSVQPPESCRRGDLPAASAHTLPTPCRHPATRHPPEVLGEGIHDVELLHGAGTPHRHRNVQRLAQQHLAALVLLLPVQHAGCGAGGAGAGLRAHGGQQGRRQVWRLAGMAMPAPRRAGSGRCCSPAAGCKARRSPQLASS